MSAKRVVLHSPATGLSVISLTACGLNIEEYYAPPWVVTFPDAVTCKRCRASWLSLGKAFGNFDGKGRWKPLYKR